MPRSHADSTNPRRLVLHAAPWPSCSSARWQTRRTSPLAWARCPVRAGHVPERWDSLRDAVAARLRCRAVPHSPARPRCLKGSAIPGAMSPACPLCPCPSPPCAAVFLRFCILALGSLLIGVGVALACAFVLKRFKVLKEANAHAGGERPSLFGCGLPGCVACQVVRAIPLGPAPATPPRCRLSTSLPGLAMGPASQPRRHGQHQLRDCDRGDGLLPGIPGGRGSG